MIVLFQAPRNVGNQSWQSATLHPGETEMTEHFTSPWRLLMLGALLLISGLSLSACELLGLEDECEVGSCSCGSYCAPEDGFGDITDTCILKYDRAPNRRPGGYPVCTEAHYDNQITRDIGMIYYVCDEVPEGQIDHQVRDARDETCLCRMTDGMIQRAGDSAFLTDGQNTYCNWAPEDDPAAAASPEYDMVVRGHEGEPDMSIEADDEADMSVPTP